MTLRYVHWQDNDMYFVYLQDYPDYMTQGVTEDDLKEHLIDLYQELSQGDLPYVRKVDDLVVTA